MSKRRAPSEEDDKKFSASKRIRTDSSASLPKINRRRRRRMWSPNKQRNTQTHSNAMKSNNNAPASAPNNDTNKASKKRQRFIDRFHPKYAGYGLEVDVTKLSAEDESFPYTARDREEMRNQVSGYYREYSKYPEFQKTFEGRNFRSLDYGRRTGDTSPRSTITTSATAVPSVPVTAPTTASATDMSGGGGAASMGLFASLSSDWPASLNNYDPLYMYLMQQQAFNRMAYSPYQQSSTATSSSLSLPTTTVDDNDNWFISEECQHGFDNSFDTYEFQSRMIAEFRRLFPNRMNRLNSDLELALAAHDYLVQCFEQRWERGMLGGHRWSSQRRSIRHRFDRIEMAHHSSRHNWRDAEVVLDDADFNDSSQYSAATPQRSDSNTTIESQLANSSDAASISRAISANLSSFEPSRRRLRNRLTHSPARSTLTNTSGSAASSANSSSRDPIMPDWRSPMALQTHLRNMANLSTAAESKTEDSPQPSPDTTITVSPSRKRRRPLPRGTPLGPHGSRGGRGLSRGMFMRSRSNHAPTDAPAAADMIDHDSTASPVANGAVRITETIYPSVSASTSSSASVNANASVANYASMSDHRRWGYRRNRDRMFDAFDWNSEADDPRNLRIGSHRDSRRYRHFARRASRSPFQRNREPKNRDTPKICAPTQAVFRQRPIRDEIPPPVSRPVSTSASASATATASLSSAGVVNTPTLKTVAVDTDMDSPVSSSFPSVSALEPDTTPPQPNSTTSSSDELDEQKEACRPVPRAPMIVMEEKEEKQMIVATNETTDESSTAHSAAASISDLCKEIQTDFIVPMTTPIENLPWWMQTVERSNAEYDEPDWDNAINDLSNVWGTSAANSASAASAAASSSSMSLSSDIPFSRAYPRKGGYLYIVREYALPQPIKSRIRNERRKKKTYNIVDRYPYINPYLWMEEKSSSEDENGDLDDDPVATASLANVELQYPLHPKKKGNGSHPNLISLDSDDEKECSPEPTYETYQVASIATQTRCSNKDICIQYSRQLSRSYWHLSHLDFNPLQSWYLPPQTSSSNSQSNTVASTSTATATTATNSSSADGNSPTGSNAAGPTPTTITSSSSGTVLASSSTPVSTIVTSVKKPSTPSSSSYGLHEFSIAPDVVGIAASCHDFWHHFGLGNDVANIILSFMTGYSPRRSRAFYEALKPDLSDFWLAHLRENPKVLSALRTPPFYKSKWRFIARLRQLIFDHFFDSEKEALLIMVREEVRLNDEWRENHLHKRVRLIKQKSLERSHSEPMIKDSKMEID